MYTLRLGPLLRTFRAFGQSGTVFLEPLHDQTEEPWQASLHLYQGEVTSCSVHRKSDKQLLWKDTQAIQWLETKEKFFWSLEESSDAVPLSFAPSSPPDHPDRPDTASKNSQEARQIQPDKQERALPLRKIPYEQQEASSLLLVVPQRTETPAESSTALPREYKRIFALVDGHRTSAQIAQLLHCPFQRVIQILRELQLRRLVEL